MPLTLEARRDLVEGLVPLSLWLARNLAQRGEPFFKALTVRTNLYRMTVLYNGKDHPASGFQDERWNALVAELQALNERHTGDAGAEAFEREGWECLRPLVEPRLAPDVLAWPKPEDRPFGFFTYGLARRGPPAIDLHLANPFVPDSPLADPAARATELLALLAEARAAHPDAANVQCGSWLNALPAFQELFPPEWTAGMSAPFELGYHYGWWGQFIDRKGGFNRRNGEKLRATGQFPYPCVKCSCLVEALRAHLLGKFGARSS